MFSIPKVVGTVVALFSFFIFIGKSDIPIKMILKLQAETFKLLDADWGSPSVFYKNARFVKIYK